MCKILRSMISSISPQSTNPEIVQCTMESASDHYFTIDAFNGSMAHLLLLLFCSCGLVLLIGVVLGMQVNRVYSDSNREQSSNSKKKKKQKRSNVHKSIRNDTSLHSNISSNEAIAVDVTPLSTATVIGTVKPVITDNGKSIENYPTYSKKKNNSSSSSSTFAKGRKQDSCARNSTKTASSQIGQEPQESSMNLLIKPSQIPKHIAVIMDGNRRFGRSAHQDPIQGHWAGGQTLVDFVQWCAEDGVEIVTVYAFSTENWHRDAMEVSTLMALFAKYARTFQTDALARNIKVNVLSTDFEHLPTQVQEAVKALEATTAHCTGFVVNICLSYGGRGELVNACKRIAERLVDDSDSTLTSPHDINEELFSAHLCTKDYPDPEIMIRTSGEYRLSNFLLWQLAYSEMFFVDKYWPQMTKLDYRNILHQYASNRKRRFGT